MQSLVDVSLHPHLLIAIKEHVAYINTSYRGFR